MFKVYSCEHTEPLWFCVWFCCFRKRAPPSRWPRARSLCLGGPHSAGECSLPISQGSRPCPEILLHLKRAFGGQNRSQPGNEESLRVCAQLREPRVAGLAPGSSAGEGPRDWGRNCPLEPRLPSPRADPKVSTFRVRPVLSLIPSRDPASRERGSPAAGGFQRHFAFPLHRVAI